MSCSSLPEWYRQSCSLVSCSSPPGKDSGPRGAGLRHSGRKGVRPSGREVVRERDRGTEGERGQDRGNKKEGGERRWLNGRRQSGVGDTTSSLRFPLCFSQYTLGPWRQSVIPTSTSVFTPGSTLETPSGNSTQGVLVLVGRVG